MKHVIQTGTDVAAICFFDPASLPDAPDQHARLRASDQEFLTELAATGKLWSKNTGADGAYLFHFYLDEPVPEGIQRYCVEPRNMDRFLVPGGTICACGVEFAARDPLRAGLGRFSHMGGLFELPAGEYAARVWRTEWPESMLERELENRLGKGAARNTNRLGMLTVVLFLTSVVLTLVTVFKTLLALAMGGSASLGWFWAASLLTWAVTLPFMRMLSRADKDPVRMEIERDFPAIVVQMNPLGHAAK